MIGALLANNGTVASAAAVLGSAVIVIAFGFWVEAKTFGRRRHEGDRE